MDIEQRAESIFDNYRDDSKYPNINEVVISKKDAIQFALDFHKQELSGIGEVVYVPQDITEWIKENPTHKGVASVPVLSERGLVHEVFCFDLPTFSKGCKVLKKLTLSG